MTQHRLTLPAVIADTQLFPCEVTVPVVGAAAVGLTVGDVAGLALPVLIALTVHLAGSGGARCTLPVARAIVGTRVDSVKTESIYVQIQEN